MTRKRLPSITSTTLPRKAEDDKVFTRNSSPSGDKAMQSVKVPPVSIQNFQDIPFFSFSNTT
ncbi:hypothetical protein [Pelagicoccus enzymogenes]|uniref:hypothetical protein n=1 Tax=Pelagicoccus enzymogenes TaxID=2773457 RepID=UPI001CD43614|nr:hypothetical protein [Pelagicoccus enzymogenes]